MGKFYLRFQWFGIILVPAIITIVPVLLGITIRWANPFMPYLTALTVGGILLAIAIITTRTARKTKANLLSLRISTLLEATYATSLAILFTSGSREESNSNSALVSVLLDRGIDDISAWLVNDVTRTLLFLLIFVFMVTVLISALREKVGMRHRTISRYEIVPILDPDTED